MAFGFCRPENNAPAVMRSKICLRAQPVQMRLNEGPTVSFAAIPVMNPHIACVLSLYRKDSTKAQSAHLILRACLVDCTAGYGDYAGLGSLSAKQTAQANRTHTFEPTCPR
eukprot:122868-Pelagomonas_calceolata.AAC.2